MQTSKIIVAQVQTHSCEDDYGRVRLKSQGIWDDETELIPVLGSLPLMKDDSVLVDVSSGIQNPVVLAKIVKKDSGKFTIFTSGDDNKTMKVSYNENSISVDIEESSDKTTFLLEPTKVVCDVSSGSGSSSMEIKASDITLKVGPTPSTSLTIDSSSVEIK